MAAQAKLTPKQRRFVDLYLGGDDGSCKWNASAAALAAGYAKRESGQDCLSNPLIRAHIDAVLQASGVSRDVALALVIDDATRSVDDIIAASRKVTPGTPAESAVISSLVSARTTARTNLAKAHGLLTDKLQVEGEFPVLRILRMGDEG